MPDPIPYGRFLLLDRIAVGGMAEVFVAIRPDDPGRLYALKRILPTLAEDEGFITMFLDEARLVVQLDHPAILPIHELGKQGAGYYIAMDYVAGRDLRALLDRTRAAGEPLPVPLVAHVGARVADALDHAHRKRDAGGAPLQVVHRDVSPANVLIGFDGAVRVIDFGIAQAAIRTRREDTVLRGKFGYMSPEMAGGGSVDRRSDVFALGVVLHEMLTGVKVFSAPSELATLEQVRAAAVRPPSALRPGLPRGLDEVVLRALARDPARRFAWASELRDALLPFARGGEPPGDPPALARSMARWFPTELRAELDRLDRLRATPPVAAPPSPEPTQVIDLRSAPPGATPPLFRLPLTPARPLRARVLLAGTLAAAGAVAVSLWLAAGEGRARAIVLPPEPPAVADPASAGPARPALAVRTARGRARIVVQPRVAATVVLDGVAIRPPLGAGELRTLDVAPGEHRIELRTEDGRRTGATVQVRPGEVSELLGVELQ